MLTRLRSVEAEAPGKESAVSLWPSDLLDIRPTLSSKPTVQIALIPIFIRCWAPVLLMFAAIKQCNLHTLLLCPLFINNPYPTLCPSLFRKARSITLLGELSSVCPLSSPFFLLVQVLAPGELVALTE